MNRIRREVLAGITVSFAMVPEVVAFAFVAGVNPLVGLYAAFAAGLVAALWGGRPAMITGGAGSLAVVSALLVRSHGVEYLFAAVLLMGLIQAGVGLLRWGKFIELVPHPVKLGFVNGLAIVILMAQLRQIPWSSPSLAAFLVICGVTVAIVGFLPKLTTVVPSALVAIGGATLLTHLLHLPISLVGDKAAIAGGMPAFHIPQIPWTLDTLQIVGPYAILLAGVGLTESLLTQQLVDEVTNTTSSSDRECVGQGLGNIVTGLVGGMGGCAMIGQTVINLESGGRERLSGVVQALCILIFIVVAPQIITAVPMAALVGVMLVVVYRTFAWSSLKQLNRIPRMDAVVQIVVAAITVWKDLATGVFVGILLSAVGYAWQSALRMGVVRANTSETEVVYTVYGTIFFASTQRFLAAFSPQSDPESIVIDFTHAYLYGHSAHEAVQVLTQRYAATGKGICLRNLSPECLALLERAGTTAQFADNHVHSTASA